jgi:hypothetical protein
LYYPFTEPLVNPDINCLLANKYTIIIGTMDMAEPANIIFHAAAPSPVFLRATTPTVRGLSLALDMVNTRGKMYSFHAPLKDKSATEANAGLSTGSMILQ